MSRPRDPDAPDALDRLAALPPPTPPPLSPALEAELAGLTPSAPRRPLRQLALLVAGSLGYAALLLYATTTRDDLGDLPTGWLVGAALGWLGGFVVPTYCALVPRRGAVTPRWLLAAVASVVASIGFVALGWWIDPGASTSGYHGWHELGRGHVCLELGLATALVPIVVGAVVLRGSMPVGSRWIAAALGAGGGALGGLLLHLHCHVANGLHVGLVHGGVVVLAALISAALVPRATDVR